MLPIYDEYVVAYRDREAVPHGPPVITSSPRELVIFRHALVIAGQMVGTWRTTGTERGVRVELTPLRRITRPERAALGEAIDRYERFLAVPVEWSLGA